MHDEQGILIKAGDLYQELNELETFEKNIEDIEPLSSLTVGCTGFYTIICC